METFLIIFCGLLIVWSLKQGWDFFRLIRKKHRLNTEIEKDQIWALVLREKLKKEGKL